MEKKKIYETIENDVMNTELNEETKSRMLRNIMNLKNEKMNIMIVGATGCCFSGRWQKWEMRASRKPCLSILSG